MFGFNTEGLFKKYKTWAKGIFYHSVLSSWEVASGGGGGGPTCTPLHVHLLGRIVLKK